MGRQKLSPTQVRRIKILLNTRDENEKKLYTHEQIAKKYKVKRSAISKIWAGMKNPMAPNARWADIEIED
jgi:transcriptional regulator with XRE-family HTH domain